jgi:cytochrome c oxidase assembly factor CtaG
VDARPADAGAGAASRRRLSRLRPPGGDWPAARRVWFLGFGLGFLVIATMSWVAAYQPVLFYARAIQTVLLVLVVPLFITLGRPFSLVGAGSRAQARAWKRPSARARPAY